MRRSNAFVAARRDAIMALLERDGQASVAELAEHFEVSQLTIRRDLDWLESRHVLSRQHGSASLLNPLGRPSGSQRVRANRAIAREAAKYVPLENLYLSPQCGFASCECGNKLTEDEQWAKVALVKRVAEKVWGEA